MQEHERLNDEERQTQRLLERLRPLKPTLSAFEVLLETQRRRSRRQLWAWRGIAACLGAGLSAALLLRPQPAARVMPPPQAQQRRPNEPAASSSHQPVLAMSLMSDATSLSGSSYVASRNRVLVLGLSGLPALVPAASPLPLPSAPPVDAPKASPLLKFVEPLVNGGRL